MKIVINNCYGGFSLSARAIKRLAQLNGQKCYFFTNPRREGHGIDFSTNVLTSMAVLKDSMFWTAYNTKTPPKSLDGDAWQTATDADKAASNARYAAAHLTNRPDDRADPKLVQVVEELGKKAAGECAELKIIEIPDGVEWEISEYDGMESVHEKHRSWA